MLMEEAAMEKACAKNGRISDKIVEYYTNKIIPVVSKYLEDESVEKVENILKNSKDEVMQALINNSNTSIIILAGAINEYYNRFYKQVVDAIKSQDVQMDVGDDIILFSSKAGIIKLLKDY